MRRFVEEDLTGAEFRECELDGARFVGVVMQNVEIDGFVTSSSSTASRWRATSRRNSTGDIPCAC